MTSSMKTTVTCPKCRERSEAEVWTSVNNVENPDEAQWLIDGFLFQHECPACGHVATLNHDCLFHDAEAKAFVLYVADRKKVADALKALEDRAPRDYLVRSVHTRDELREKAAILRDGLDDRAVEVVKLAAFNKFAEAGELPAQARALYGALAEDGGIIVEFVTDEGAIETTVPRDLYDRVAKSFTDAQPSVVDRVWATKILAEWD